MTLFLWMQIPYMPPLPETPLPLEDKKDSLVPLSEESVVFFAVVTFLGKSSPE